MSENAIRDELAMRLDLIEPGLVLLAKEYKLPNKAGSAGRIDILARDETGCLVVIELKRSNAAARQALHELAKYVELLQREKGIGSADVRVLIVSTEWRELLAPFSQAAREWSANLRGYQLVLERDGVTPVGAREVRPLDEASLVDATPIQLLIQPNDGDLEGAWHGIKARMDKVGVKNLIGFDIRHPVYDPGIYLVLGRVPREGDAVARLMGVAKDRTFDMSGAPEGYDIEYAALHYLCSELTGLRLEHVGPDKLAGIIQDTRWEVSGVRRGGVFEEPVLFPSDELIASASIGGISDVAFNGSAKSDHPQRWNRFTVRVQFALSTNAPWSTIVSAWLQELADMKSPTHAGAKVFSPCDLVSAFAFGWPDKLEGYLPSLELVASGGGAGSNPPWDPRLAEYIQGCYVRLRTSLQRSRAVGNLEELWRGLATRSDIPSRAWT
ncbi:endonuclease NucS domain-containing protein [Micromonospora sp. CA-248089]|uniref:endonuclease NucS domain-containing protein n=1 Tax=Micromonospora sp. CA-248089 TaxID=3239960 RepID=UPI003D911667